MHITTNVPRQVDLASNGRLASRLAPPLFAALIGIFIVGFVGFSHMDVVHNAAHDARHANAFPCH